MTDHSDADELRTIAADDPLQGGGDGGELSRRLIMMLSHERSGSHYLADLLQSGGEVASLDEVCNFRAVDPDTSRTSFFRFRREWQELNPQLAVRPDAPAISAFLQSYLVYLLGLSNKGLVLVDIKYGHVHNFEPAWWPSELRPFLLKFAQRHNVRIIHLTRRDSLASVVSGTVAEERQLWHRRNGSPSQAGFSVRVPVPQVIQKTLALEREKANFSAWLAGNERLNISYEDITGSEAVRGDALARVAAFLGLQTQTFTTSFEKVTPPLHEVVKNYKELRRWLTPLGIRNDSTTSGA